MMGGKPKTLSDTQRYLRHHWRPLHPLPLHKVERRHAAAYLAEIATRNRPIAATRAGSIDRPNPHTIPLQIENTFSVRWTRHSTALSATAHRSKTTRPGSTGSEQRASES